MAKKALIKKLIPKSVKNQIKKSVQSESGKAGYELRLSDRKRLDGRKVFVTGGSGGIGSAICFRLAMEGAIVGVGGRNAEKLNLVVENILNNGGKAKAVKIDITDDNSVEKALSDFAGECGGIDVLINNAGGSARGESKQYEDQDFCIINDVLETNLVGTMRCTRAALKMIKDSKAGRIINLSSVVGLQGKNGMTDYAAAKSGIIGFTRSLALEMGKYGITVNCVSPGWTGRGLFDHNKPVQYKNVNCLGHSGKADDVAGLIAYLLSDEASYITGQNIIIDGGRSLGLWGDN